MYTLDNLWVLIAAALVFFMQAGFALVEVGFTRSKNAGNILMKNFVDFVVGTIFFFFIGFSLMYGEDIAGFIGKLDFNIISDRVKAFSEVPNLERSGLTPYTDFFFQVVFAATAATIISGAMAERTNFAAYIVVSVFITAVIYPIQGHWIWGGGWLSQLGFHDFAGSTAVHSVGGWASLVGTIVLGPRIGKYVNGKSQAILGHNIIYGGLGVFILWIGWFGFNPGSALGFNVTAEADKVLSVSSIFVTTNAAAATGFVAAMFTSWIKYKKPDVSMSLNGVLAGLVAVTAGCDVVSPEGAMIIGAIAGVIVVLSVDFIDKVLKLDDPVGAISVHGVCGALGTLLVGFFDTTNGLFYGGEATQLLNQAIGVVAVMGTTIVLSYIMFKVIDMTMKLRVSKTVEIEGLDIHEHGQSVYNN
ncbi:MAG: ammonium transporter [Bacteroidales bacterium]|nr:ammonium transporter [Bacteroidales bacterium]